MSKPNIDVVERDKFSRIEIRNENGEGYNLEITENGIQVTSLFDDTDMVVKARTSNQILITNVPKVYL